MAIIRAFLRRRLGRIPSYSLAVAGYELEFLATHITYTWDIHNFADKNKPKFPCLASDPADVFKWEIATADPTTTKRHTPYISTNEHEPRDTSKKKPARKRPLQPRSSTNYSKYANAEFHEATSAQLLHVRKRLGDLCAWDSKALEISIALVRSIEYLLNQTLKDALSGQPSEIQWELQTWEPTRSSETLKSGSFSIPIIWSNENWTVDLGIIEAVLSMWMATIEALGGAQRNWRRTKSSIGTKYTFSRILGVYNEDQILQRDLSWWIDDFRLYSNDSPQGKSDATGVDLAIGFHGNADGT